MNKQSAKAAKEFSKIVARDKRGRPVVVTTPGHKHNRTVYFLRNGSLRARCTWMSMGTGMHDCPGNSNGSICYHVLAAVEAVAEDAGKSVAWCDSEADARRLARLGGKVFCIESGQGRGEAWGVTKSEAEEVDPVVAKAREFLAIWDKFQNCQETTEAERERFHELEIEFGVRGWSVGMIKEAAK